MKDRVRQYVSIAVLMVERSEGKERGIRVKGNGVGEEEVQERVWSKGR